MKQLLLACFFFPFCAVHGQTNIYHEFPDNSASWNFYYYAYCFSFGSADEYYSIVLSGDTLVNNQTYHQLNTPYVESYSTGSCGGSGVPPFYRGALREDVVAKKVYYLPPSEQNEQLLYDFTMAVGDTVRGYTQLYAQPFPDVVESIDSVLVGNTYRKRWNISMCYNIHFIEGIGSTYGLFQFSPGCMTDQADFSLTCFQQNGDFLYPGSAGNCDLITSVNETSSDRYPVKVFPNPSCGTVTIDLENTGIKEIRLTDLTGKIILQQQVSSLTKFEINNLQTGTYVLTVTDYNNRTSNKKIIRCP